MNKEPSPNQLTKNQVQSIFIAIGVLLIFLGINAVFIFISRSESPNNVVTFATTTNAGLVVQPQVATDSVHVDQVTLPRAGFLAIRGMDNGRPGQIIEISQYFKAGTHNNITIPLGDFYEGGEELIVMAYEDIGEDKIFNDLDQPLTENDLPFSAYIATGDPAPASVLTSVVDTDAMHMMDNPEMVTVRYTNMGFEPKELSVPLGAMIQFVNESDKKMWVASNEHPGHSILPTFDQFQTGDLYLYVFDKAGTWEYHDHLNPTAVGIITVEAR